MELLDFNTLNLIKGTDVSMCDTPVPTVGNPCTTFKI